MSGAAVTLSELNEDYTQTGRSFQAAVVDDTDAFEFDGIELRSFIATLRVDGFFFNEVKGKRSDSQITLGAITSLEEDAERNVNLLSTLEKARVETLLREGIPFDEAKNQARAELFVLFGFEPADGTASEQVSLAAGDDEAAKLLAASVLLLGYRSDSRLTELLASLSTDLREDGTFDSKETLRDLVLHARALDLPRVRSNLEERYAELGKTVSLAEFEPYVEQFVEAHEEQPAGSILEFGEGSLLETLVAGRDGMELPETPISSGGVESSVVLTGNDVPFHFVYWVCTDSVNWSLSQPVNFIWADHESELLMSEDCHVGVPFT